MVPSGGVDLPCTVHLESELTFLGLWGNMLLVGLSGPLINRITTYRCIHIYFVMLIVFMHVNSCYGLLIIDCFQGSSARVHEEF